MSTTSSSLMTKLYEIIPTVTGFSDKKRLVNPYVLNNNPEQVLKNGYGVLVGAGEVQQLSYCRDLRYDHEYTVVLTEQVSGSDLTPTYLDTIISNMSNDISYLINYLTSNDSWAYPVKLIDFSAKSLSEVVYNDENEKLRYITRSVTFNAIYQGELT